MYALITEMYTFQSTLPRGERPQAMLKMVAEATVSIHAPTRGATAEGSTISPLPREKRD